MLRITIQESADGVTLILEGRLTGPWIQEVEHAWSAVAGGGDGRPVVVDLSGVTFVDEEGKQLLRSIFVRGGELRASDVMTRAIVEEVRQQTHSESQ
jgi:anti-anti-sigma regulatory factor